MKIATTTTTKKTIIQSRPFNVTHKSFNRSEPLSFNGAIDPVSLNDNDMVSFERRFGHYLDVAMSIRSPNKGCY